MHLLKYSLINSGKPINHAKCMGIKASIGIEINPNRTLIALNSILRLMQNGYMQDGCGVSVRYGNACTDFANYDPVTHIYSFDEAMPAEDMMKIGQRCSVSTSVQYYVSYHHPSTFSTYGFIGFEYMDICYRVNMSGSSSHFTAYFYKRSLIDSTVKLNYPRTEELSQAICDSLSSEYTQSKCEELIAWHQHDNMPKRACLRSNIRSL